MFEKEAIRHAFEVTIGLDCLIKPAEEFTYDELNDHLQEKADDFQYGAEFGYNKANEWHYPSKGEYPKERQLVLGIFQPSEFYTPTELVFYEKELDCWSNQMGESEYHNIYAWKEIVLPKECE